MEGSSMAEVTNQPGDGNVAPELSGKRLPQVEYQDLPEPKKLRQIVGASVILLATGLGSGELVLWPYITSQVGLGFLWLALIGITLQFFVNMEVERYTLATGETAVTGFSRLWLPWGTFFVLGGILIHIWPGWATGGTTLLTFLFGLSSSAVAPLSVILLVAIGLALTLSPVVYQTIEKVEMVLIGIILVFMVTAIVVVTDATSWGAVVTAAPTALANFSEYAGVIGVVTLFGAVAFAGVGAPAHLVQSNWIRDKGMGMGARIPRLVSPITGEEEAQPSIGYMVRPTDENMRRWRGWWKVANQEQLLTFWFIGILALIALSVLAYATLGVGNFERGLGFVKGEGQYLSENIAPWFGKFFFVAGFAILFSTNIGIMDYTSRLAADSLKVTFLKESTFWSESKIYSTVVWTIVAAGSAILLGGFSQPLVLLVIAAAGGGLLIPFYSVLLIIINRRLLPDPFKLKGWRLVMMCVTAAFFISFSLFLIVQLIINGVSAAAALR